MKRCDACQSRAYLADVHCQRCGAAIVPPPPAWLANVRRVFLALAAVSVPFQVNDLVNHTDTGRRVVTALSPLARYLVANASDIAGITLAFIVAPLVGLYFALRAMVDIGDWLDWKTQQWRAERFRKYGW